MQLAVDAFCVEVDTETEGVYERTDKRQSSERYCPNTVKCMLLSVEAQLLIYCARQLHVSATEHRRRQADYKHKMEVFTIAWFDISEAYR